MRNPGRGFHTLSTVGVVANMGLVDAYGVCEWNTVAGNV